MQNLMQMKRALLFIVSAILLLASHLSAAAIKVEFVKPNEFRDIKLTGLTKTKSIKQLERQMLALFNEASRGLIDDSQELTIKVTNIDLAGYMEHFYGPQNRDMRILRSSEFFRLEFDYEFKDEQGEVQKAGQAKIKQLVDHKPIRVKTFKYKSVAYMRNEVESWLKDQLQE